MNELTKVELEAINGGLESGWYYLGKFAKWYTQNSMFED